MNALTARLAAIIGLLALACTAIPASAATLNDDPDARILRVERWLKAAFSHQPGLKDDAFTEVSLWSDTALRALFVDEGVLPQLMLNPARDKVRVPTIGGRLQPPAYTDWQIHRLHVLACAASGDLTSSACVPLKADEIDAALTRLAKAVEARGERDYVLRRGALLHSDIAMFGPEQALAPEAATAGGGITIRVQMQDGESSGFNAAPIHWQMARQLLDNVKPSAADAFVRQWYRATAMWMQDRQQHDTAHLKHAREMFPDDPDILFLSGCQQETYAGSAIQSVVRSAVLPQGFTLDVASEATALRDAEEYFRRALARDPQMREARIRLGHVLLARGRPQQAADDLKTVDADSQPPILQYFHALFSGTAEEALGHFDQAHDWYARAVALYPAAQSPHLALAALATRRGDRTTALKETQVLFDLPAVVRDPDDPWWADHVVQARDTTLVFEQFYRRYADY